MIPQRRIKHFVLYVRLKRTPDDNLCALESHSKSNPFKMFLRLESVLENAMGTPRQISLSSALQH